MFSPWLLNVLLIVGIVFSVNRTVQKDNAFRAFTQDFKISRTEAMTLIEELPSATLREILKKGSFAGANLEGITLDYADLPDINLSGARLKGASLRSATLANAKLDGTDLRLAQLDNTNFAGASLRNVRLQESQLGGANFENTNLQGASLWDAHADGAVFSNANLRGATLVGASMHRVNVDGTDLAGTALHGTDFSNTNLEGASFNQTYYSSETIFPGGFAPSGYYGLQEGQLHEDEYFPVNAEKDLDEYRNGASADSLIEFLSSAPGYLVESFLAQHQDELPKGIVDKVK